LDIIGTKVFFLFTVTSTTREYKSGLYETVYYTYSILEMYKNISVDISPKLSNIRIAMKIVSL